MAPIVGEYIDLCSNNEELHLCLSRDRGSEDSSSSDDEGDAELPMEHLSDNDVKEGEPSYEGPAKENKLIKALCAKVQNPDPGPIRHEHLKWDHFVNTGGGAEKCKPSGRHIRRHATRLPYRRAKGP